MEEELRIKYVMMIGIISIFFQGPLSQILKWFTLLGALILLLAFILFAIDGIIPNIVPENIAKITAWIGILFTAILLVLWWITNEMYFNISI